MAVTINNTQLINLKSDMANGPLSAQVTPLLHADPEGIARLYNAVGSETILIPSLSRDDFLLGILPAGGALFGKDSATQGKWNFYLDIAKAASTIKLGNPVIQSVLGQLVSDGLMDQPSVDAFSKQPCSHAETLFGIGAKLTGDDIQAASELA